ncbi:MAG: phosphopantetheine-binding [Herminiimonas sp.]|nr:phosphopantetheine-binding [Herminiimonas sp.]
MSTLERLQTILMGSYPLERGQLSPDALLSSLEIDSLGVMELLFAIEDEFNLKVPNDTQNLKTVGDVVDLIDNLQQSQTAGSDAVIQANEAGRANPVGHHENTVAARRLP